MDKYEQIQLKVDVWKKVVDVQMHFNDLCLKLRHVGISILGVLLGAAALTYRYGGTTNVMSFQVQTSIVFILVALIVWIAFYLMDRFWYHELLKGAVHHGLKIEEALRNELPSIDLAHTIRDQSHSSLKLNAAKKLDLFYRSIVYVLCIGLFFLSWWVGGIVSVTVYAGARYLDRNI